MRQRTTEVGLLGLTVVAILAVSPVSAGGTPEPVVAAADDGDAREASQDGIQLFEVSRECRRIVVGAAGTLIQDLLDCYRAAATAAFAGDAPDVDGCTTRALEAHAAAVGAHEDCSICGSSSDLRDEIEVAMRAVQGDVYTLASPRSEDELACRNARLGLIGHLANAMVRCRLRGASPQRVVSGAPRCLTRALRRYAAGVLDQVPRCARAAAIPGLPDVELRTVLDLVHFDLHCDDPAPVAAQAPTLAVDCRDGQGIVVFNTSVSDPVTQRLECDASPADDGTCVAIGAIEMREPQVTTFAMSPRRVRVGRTRTFRLSRQTLADASAGIAALAAKSRPKFIVHCGR